MNEMTVYAWMVRNYRSDLQYGLRKRPNGWPVEEALVKREHAQREVAALQAEIAIYREILACAYQLAGFHDAPDPWLDVLSDAANGTPPEEWRVRSDFVDLLLPYSGKEGVCP